MKTIIKPAIILMLVAFLSALALSHIKKITYPRILLLKQQKEENAIAIVLPGYVIGEQKQVDMEGEKFTYWEAEKKDENDKAVKGYAFITGSPGYSGDVVSMVGIDEGGTILGISILHQTETPGLGARCEEVASSKTFFGAIFGSDTAEEEDLLPWFQEQFKGLKINEKIGIFKNGDWNESMKEGLIEKNGVTAITGATITTRALIKSLEKGIANLNEALHKRENGNSNENLEAAR